MADSNTNGATGGVSMFGLLTVLFVGLKLTGYIDWSWGWVLAPLWLPFAVAIVILIAAIIGFLAFKGVTKQ